MVLLVCFVSLDTRCRFNFFNELSPLSFHIFTYFSAEAGANIKPFFHSWKTFTIVFLTPQKKPCQKHAKAPKNNGWKPKKFYPSTPNKKYMTFALRDGHFDLVVEPYQNSVTLITGGWAESKLEGHFDRLSDLYARRLSGAEAGGSLRQAQWPW